jgi:hypothetical protein
MIDLLLGAAAGIALDRYAPALVIAAWAKLKSLVGK